MIMRALLFLVSLAVWAAPARADVLVAARTIPSKSIIAAEDLVLVINDQSGPAMDAQSVIGQEARVVLYEGRPIRRSDIGPAALVERNQIVVTIYENGPLRISTEGRALGRAAEGEPVRVMNIASRKIIMGVVAANGTIFVSSFAQGSQP